jgi:hypothetical protein
MWNRKMKAFLSLNLLAIAAFLVLTSLAPVSVSAKPQSSLALIDSSSQCVLEVPPQWKTTKMVWSGLCKSKLAQGNGVARIMLGATVVGAWYGDVENGKITTGVLEQGNKHQLGTFDSNFDLLSIDGMEPNRAMTAAGKAADALAKSYEKSGNKKSAQFYRTKADDLRYLTGN